jgi:vancomycin resistance protein YoaR
VNAEKMNWGMKIANTPVSGLSFYEAEDLLESKFQDLMEKKFFLNYKDFYWQTSLKELGIEIDIPTTIKLAFKRGHETDSPLTNAWWQIASLSGYNAKPILKINEEKLENFLRKNLSSVHQPAKNASLIYSEEKDDFIQTSSEKGVIVDKDNLRKELLEIINNHQEKDIEISLLNDYPEILESETENAYQNAKTLLEIIPIKVSVFENEEQKEIDSLEKELLLSLINFKPVPDPKDVDNKILGVRLSKDKTEEYLIFLGQIVNRGPVDAQFTIKDDRVVAFALSEEGVKLEIEKNIGILSKEILSGKNEIQLETSKIQPKITTDSINNLGIKALLAKGISDFSGSPNSRIHNIKIGIAKFNGVLIKPDEEFSFNKVLGKVGPEQGYQPELVIKKDKTIPEYGGGLCQVSTTMFRAAINAGLEITQRYPHAFPVKYYNPQGFDATIYPPFPDLRFINTTSKHVLIQTKINGYELIFELYGTNDEREIEIDGPYQYDIKEDGSMKARLIQKVYDKDGNIILDKTFYSNYKSPNLYPVEKNPLE